MIVFCPHCHDRLTFSIDAPSTDVECSSCRQRFSLTPEHVAQSRPAEETATYVSMGETPAPVRTNRRLQIGDYDIVREIARGGMGIVYEARQRKLQRVVALKLIRSGELADAQQIVRFYTEARAAARLDHPGIVSVYEVGEHQGQHFIALAYIDGSSLKEHVTRGPLAPWQGAAIMRQVAEAVQYAHEHGVIHRDLKPHNILLDKSGVPHVTDFGLAKNLLDDAEMTASGQILGTPAYMSPEQARGDKRDVDERSDVYSLGATLYCLLTGQPPVVADSPVETIRLVIDADPVPLRQLNRALPRDLEAVCLKALSKERHARYASAREFADDLGRFLNHQPVRARRLGLGTRATRWLRRRPAVAAAIGALVLGCVASLYFAIQWLRTEAFAREETERADQATQAIGDAQSQASESEERLRRGRVATAREQMANGLEACERGESDLGLHWLIRALDTAPLDETALQTSLRRNINIWGATIHRLCRQYEPAAQQPLSTGPAFGSDGNTALRINYSLQGGRIQGAFLSLIDSATGKTLAERRFDSDSWESGASANWFHSPVWWSPDLSRVIVADNGSAYQKLGANEIPARPARLAVWDCARGEIFSLPIRDDRMFQSVAVSRDGSWIATVEAPIRGESNDAAPFEIRVRSAADGRATLERSGYRRLPASPVFSPEAARCVVPIVEQHAAEICQTLDGTRIGEPLLLDGELSSAAFSADGRLLATADGTVRVRLWRGLNGSPVGQAFEGGIRRPLNSPLEHRNSDVIRTIGLSSDGTRLLAFSPSHQLGRATETIRLWTLDQGTQLGQTLRRRTLQPVLRNDGDELLLPGVTAYPAGYPTQVWRLALTPPAADEPKRPDALAANPTELRLWAEIATGAELAADDNLRVLSLAEWTSRRNQFVGDEVAESTADASRASAADDTVRAESYPASSWIETRQVAVSRSGAGLAPIILAQARGRRGLEFSPDGTTAVQIPSFNLLQLVDAHTGAARGAPLDVSYLQPLRYIHGIAFSADSAVLLTGSGNDVNAGAVHLWNVHSGTLVGGPLVHNGTVGAVAFSPAGDLFVSGYGDNELRQAAGGFRGYAQVWDTATLKRIGPPLEHNGRVTETLFTPDGRTLFTASTIDPEARLWNVDTLQPVGRPLSHMAGVVTSAMSPDGAVVATGSFDKSLRLWNTRDGTLIGAPLAHNGPVLSVVFSPDGRRIASGSQDGYVRLWDVATQHLVGEPYKHGTPVDCLAFGAGGRVLASAALNSSPRFANAVTGAGLPSPVDVQAAQSYVGFRPDGALLMFDGGKICIYEGIDWQAALRSELK